MGSVVKKEVRSQEEDNNDLSGSVDDGLSLTRRIKVKNTTTITTTMGMEENNME